jgi:hypothetical protein
VEELLMGTCEGCGAEPLRLHDAECPVAAEEIASRVRDMVQRLGDESADLDGEHTEHIGPGFWERPA